MCLSTSQVIFYQELRITSKTLIRQSSVKHVDVVDIGEHWLNCLNGEIFVTSSSLLTFLPPLFPPFIRVYQYTDVFDGVKA